MRIRRKTQSQKLEMFVRHALQLLRYVLSLLTEGAQLQKRRSHTETLFTVKT